MKTKKKFYIRSRIAMIWSYPIYILFSLLSLLMLYIYHYSGTAMAFQEINQMIAKKKKERDWKEIEKKEEKMFDFETKLQERINQKENIL